MGLGQETCFDFKYIPELSKTTRMEEPPEISIRGAGVERRNLGAFIAGCCLFSAISFIGLNVALAVTRSVAAVETWNSWPAQCMHVSCSQPQ